MSADRLTPLDATFLELEEVDAAAHMHIGSLMVFEAHPGTPPKLPRLRRQIEHRLAALPRYRCRLSQPHTGGLTWPAWVVDPGFRIEDHVRRAELPGPGGRDVMLTGIAQINDDSSRAITSRLPTVLTIIAAITFVLLFLLTGSVVYR